MRERAPVIIFFLKENNAAFGTFRDRRMKFLAHEHLKSFTSVLTCT